MTSPNPDESVQDMFVRLCKQADPGAREDERTDYDITMVMSNGAILCADTEARYGGVINASDGEMNSTNALHVDFGNPAEVLSTIREGIEWGAPWPD
jgi:hypothetical protein